MADTRTKAQKSASAKKGARTRKRNLAKTPTRKTTTRRRQTRKSNFGLSEMFNPKMAQAGAKSTVSGGVGGGVAGLLWKMLPNATPIQKVLAGSGLSFISATMVKMPNVGAGIMGGTVALGMQEQGMLNEGGMERYPYASGIDSLPMVLNENGEELYLQEEGDDMYLQQDENMYLQDDIDYNVGYYGQGFGGR